MERGQQFNTPKLPELPPQQSFGEEVAGLAGIVTRAVTGAPGFNIYKEILGDKPRTWNGTTMYNPDASVKDWAKDILTSAALVVGAKGGGAGRTVVKSPTKATTKATTGATAATSGSKATASAPTTPKVPTPTAGPKPTAPTPPKVTTPTPPKTTTKAPVNTKPLDDLFFPTSSKNAVVKPKPEVVAPKRTTKMTTKKKTEEKPVVTAKTKQEAKADKRAKRTKAAKTAALSALGAALLAKGKDNSGEEGWKPSGVV
jgi:hypothetical protein